MAGLLATMFAPDGIDVLNAAVQGYSPAIYWKKIEDLLERRRLRFDAVIVFIDISVQTLYPHPPWIGCTPVEADKSSCRAAWTLSRVAMDRFGQDGLRRADGHMTQLAALLRAHRIPLTVAVHPWPHQMRWNDRSSVQVFHWSRWAEREEAQFIDLFSPFFAEIDVLGTTEAIRRHFIAGDVHWAALGHRLVAETVGRQFARPGKAVGE